MACSSGDGHCDCFQSVSSTLDGLNTRRQSVLIRARIITLLRRRFRDRPRPPNGQQRNIFPYIRRLPDVYSQQPQMCISHAVIASPAQPSTAASVPAAVKVIPSKQSLTSPVPNLLTSRAVSNPHSQIRTSLPIHPSLAPAACMKRSVTQRQKHPHNPSSPNTVQHTHTHTHPPETGGRFLASPPAPAQPSPAQPVRQKPEKRESDG